jgi:putative Holliday junction resolvase
MRVLGVDVGRRRIGLAISDVSATLARPLTTLTVDDLADGVRRVAAEVARLSSEDDGLAAVVVGMPLNLDGSRSDATAEVARFSTALAARVGVPVLHGDERLTSREAESRLAARERDWRRRKQRLDAAAAAIILQDYLDGQHAVPPDRQPADDPHRADDSHGADDPHPADDPPADDRHQKDGRRRGDDRLMNR